MDPREEPDAPEPTADEPVEDDAAQLAEPSEGPSGEPSGQPEPSEEPEQSEEPEEPEGDDTDTTGDPDADKRRRRRNAIAIGVFLVTVIGIALVLYFTVFSGSRFVEHRGSTAAEAESSSSETTPPTMVEIGPPPDRALPTAEELADVLYRLADPNTPGDQKIYLIEGATDANAINAFAKALQDTGNTPINVTVQNVQWASSPRGHVTADVTISGPNGPAFFPFPMEFAPLEQGGWQLSHNVASILLTFNQNPATPTSPPPSPTPTG